MDDDEAAALPSNVGEGLAAAWPRPPPAKQAYMINRLGATLLSLVLVGSACTSAEQPHTPPASPGQLPPDSGQPSALPPRATDRPPQATDAEPQPTGSGAVSPVTPPLPSPETTQVPLPEPSLSDAALIGQALYDPTQVVGGVVSLLQAAGVEITGRDGTVIRPGAGELSMSEDEVRGLIGMTIEDLEDVTDEGVGPVSVADLHRGLASSLPADFTDDEFAAAFDEAYASDPSSLAAGVMLGMPITRETKLMRVQVWLLIVDAFLGPEESAAPGSQALAVVSQRSGDVALRSGVSSLGAAAALQPPLVSPMAGVSDRLWASLLAMLPTLAFRIPFTVDGFAPVHEGHGGQGPRLELAARIGRPADVIRIRTGQILIPAAEPGDGLPMTWSSYDEAVLSDHGQVVGQLNWPMLTDTSGAVHIAYQVKKEEARQRNVEMSESGTLYAKVEARGLVVEAYDLPPEIYDVLACECLITGTVNSSNYEFPITWHEAEVLELYIENRYNYTFTVGGIAELHRNGVDKAHGVLAYKATDKTYRGTLDAISQGHAEGTAVLALGGIATCGDDALGVQRLYVVGEQRGSDFLLLRFYPETPPDGEFTPCQATIPFAGGGKYRRPFGSYLPLNDTRWSTPSTGYEIQIPSTFGTLEYVDDSASASALGVCSEFFVSVTKVDPDASPPASPSPQPQPANWLCQ